MNNLAMHDPFLIQTYIDIYYGELDMDNKNLQLLTTGKGEKTITPFERQPTVPGLALALGFRSKADIQKTLKDASDGISKYPQECVDMLIMALTKMEDWYIQRGLANAIPPAIMKFMLSAYHDVSEGSQVPEIIGKNSGNVQIVFEAPKEYSPAQQHIEAKETARIDHISHQGSIPDSGQGHMLVEIPN
jgi:hypothetical protein